MDHNPLSYFAGGMPLSEAKGDEMFKTTAIAYSAAVVAICFLSACSKQEPQKTESPRTASLHPAASSQQEQIQTGEALFRQFCFNCHPEGGNLLDTKKTLHGPDLRRNQITVPEDIVKIMRNPRSRMLRFDPETIPDKDARTIAEYVLKTFR